MENLKELLKKVERVEVGEYSTLNLFLEDGNRLEVSGDNGGELFYYLYDKDNKCLRII